MGGALVSADTGSDVGSVEASDGGVAKVISSTGESDALGAAFSESVWPFTLASGSLFSGVAFWFCALGGGTTASALALPRTALRFGSGGGSCTSAREARGSA